MTFSPHFTITNTITTGLTKIERARGFQEAAKLSEDWIAGMQARALVLKPTTPPTLRERSSPWSSPSDCSQARQSPRVIRRAVILSKARIVGMKARPVAVLAFLLDQGKGTVAECEAALKENRRTLQRDLKLLVSKGFAREVGTGPTDPTKYYEPVL